MPIQLTPRERQVVRLLSLGCTVREAAKVLKLAAEHGRQPQGQGHE